MLSPSNRSTSKTLSALTVPCSGAAQAVGNLLDENDDADGGEHSLNYVGGKVLPHHPSADNAEHQLGNAADDDQAQKPRNQPLGFRHNDDRQPAAGPETPT